MLTKKEIEEFRKELDTAVRPLIFFDDDTDGTASFLLFYAYMKDHAEVKGIVVKSGPELTEDIYLKKIQEYMPDKVFVLDKPMVSQDLIDKAHVKIISLDHHTLAPRNGMIYFNPLKHKAKGFNPDNRPTSYWAFKIIEHKKELRNDKLWLMMAGVVGDWYVPEFTKEFSEKYPDLLPKTLKIKNPGTILFESPLGKLIKIFEFNMKYNTHEVMTFIKILSRIQDPYEILNQTTPQGKYIYKQYEKVNIIYEQVKSTADTSDKKIIYFNYKEKFMFTGNLANEFQYYHPNKVILITRDGGDKIICSLRSQKLNIRVALGNALVGINGHGGGHDHACGAGIAKDDFDRFFSQLKEEIHKLKESTTEKTPPKVVKTKKEIPVKKIIVKK